MLDLITPQLLLPTVTGAGLALLVTALGQRWGPLGGALRPAAASPEARAPAAEEPALVAERTPERAPERFGDAPPPCVARLTEARASRRYMRREVAVVEFLTFLRGSGNTGWFAAEHIDMLWEWFCDRHNVVEMDPRLIRAELAAMPACRHGQKRLNGPEFIELRAALGRARAHVYYIPPADKPMPSRQAPHDAETGRGAHRAAGRSGTGGTTAGAQKAPRKRVLAPAAPLPEWRQVA